MCLDDFLQVDLVDGAWKEASRILWTEVDWKWMSEFWQIYFVVDKESEGVPYGDQDRRWARVC